MKILQLQVQGSMHSVRVSLDNGDIMFNMPDAMRAAGLSQLPIGQWPEWVFRPSAVRKINEIRKEPCNANAVLKTLEDAEYILNTFAFERVN